MKFIVKWTLSKDSLKIVRHRGRFVNYPAPKRDLTAMVTVVVDFGNLSLWHNIKPPVFVHSRARFPLQSMASELDTFNLSNCKVRHFGIRNCWTQAHHSNILTDSLYLSPSRSSNLESFYEGGGGMGSKVSPFLAHSTFLVNGMIREFKSCKDLSWFFFCQQKCNLHFGVFVPSSAPPLPRPASLHGPTEGLTLTSWQNFVSHPWVS